MGVIFMTCNACSSDNVIEGKLESNTLRFTVLTPKQSFPYVEIYDSKLGATACKDCGNIVQVKLQNLEGLKKLEGTE